MGTWKFGAIAVAALMTIAADAVADPPLACLVNCYARNKCISLVLGVAHSSLRILGILVAYCGEK